MKNRSQQNQDSSKFLSRLRRIGRITLIFLLIIIIVIPVLVGYNYYLQNQLNQLRSDAIILDYRLKQMELGAVEDISVQQLAEKLEFLTNQQQISLASTQQLIDYMTFTFTLIGVFFLLVSGYFVYRQQKSEQREDEGWVLAKDLLELVTQSQQFVVQVQDELRNQQKLQEDRRNQMGKQLKGTVDFLNNTTNMRVTNFARDTISERREFARLADISTRIDSIRFQLPDFDLSLNLNCYFLKAVYEYIIGNYNAARDEFDNLIKARKDNILNQDAENKQLSLCYYYRGLIGYNIQEDLLQAEKFMDLAVKVDPQINGPDFKSLLLRAEINFKLQKPEAFDLYDDITKQLEGLTNLTETQKRLMSHAYLGMVYCKVLEGSKKFLPSYYDRISQQIDDNVISDVIEWLNKSADSHIYTLLTLGQLSVVFEETNRNVKELEPSDEYFQRAYKVMEASKPYEEKEETRAKILAYSAKLVCEKFLNKSMDRTKLTLKNLLNDQELKAIYSIFSKANVSKMEYTEELNAFG